MMPTRVRRIANAIAHKKKLDEHLAEKARQDELEKVKRSTPYTPQPLIIPPVCQTNRRKSPPSIDTNKGRKTLPTNDGGTIGPITTSFFRRSSGTGFFPPRAVIRGMKIKRGSFLDIRIVGYEGRVGLSITIADTKTSAGLKQDRRRVIPNMGGRFFIPVSKSNCDVLEFKHKSRIAVHFIPGKGKGKSKIPAFMFVYKEQGMVDSGRKKSLVQEVLEAAAKLKDEEERYHPKNKGLEGLEWLVKRLEDAKTERERNQPLPPV